MAKKKEEQAPYPLKTTFYRLALVFRCFYHGICINDRFSDDYALDLTIKEEKQMENTLIELFERTLKNCAFYEKEGKTISLANEIGVLRGIGYCMELEGECSHTEEFMHFIEIQKKLQELDNN